MWKIEYMMGEGYNGVKEENKLKEKQSVSAMLQRWGKKIRRNRWDKLTWRMDANKHY